MSNPDDHDLKPEAIVGRVVVTILGIAFGGIGLAVMGFLWTEHGFGEPPTFFKIFGTCVALPFVGFGVGALLVGLGVIGVWTKSPAETVVDQLKEMQRELGDQRAVGEPDAAATNYTCPHCSAPLASSADASPHGDVKCAHCGAWFNIYGK